MRAKLILAAVFILTLPLWLSASGGHKLGTSVPFGAVAYAGHTISGEFCPCGIGPWCFCDPGELSSRDNEPVSGQPKKHLNQGASPIPAHTDSGLDFGAGALMLALALFVWARLRA